MSVFYENYLKFCNEVNKTPSAVALEIGLSKTAVNGWKYNRSNPTDATLQKVADYFGVTVDVLDPSKKNKPATHEERELTEKQLRMWNLIKDMDDQHLEGMEIVARMNSTSLDSFIATAKAFLPKE